MATPPAADPPLPTIGQLGTDLLRITPVQRAVTLVVPFASAAAFFALALPWTPAPAVYAALMVTGAWAISLATSYLPHNPAGATALRQTRLFRGVVARVIAMEHLYHLEHHLYPMVPHHNWPALARRLDPYFQSAGVDPIVLGF